MHIERHVVILDGSRPHDADDLALVLRQLVDEYTERGAEVTVYALRDAKIGHCVGCFGCWVRTPGECVINDEGREIARAIAQSDTTVLFSPVLFGGYSVELKKMVDRFLPLILPFFGTYRGEFHHAPRYDRYPRLVGVGVRRSSDSAESDGIFRVLIGRNALNFHAPSYAATVVSDSDTPRELSRRFRSLITTEDEWPLDEALAALPVSATPSRATTQPARTQRALLLLGSPKFTSPSTSGALGGYLMERLGEHGWETETLKLSARESRQGGWPALISAVERADMVVLAFPLYIDTLPVLVTAALEALATHRRALGSRTRHVRLAVISNNGFPEAQHNLPAVATCRRFAEESGIVWAGALAMGAGEAISGGRPLYAPNPTGLPTDHVARALQLAAEELAAGRPVSDEARATISQVPIPGAPAAAWYGVFGQTAEQHWKQTASGNGLSAERILGRPYQVLEASCA